MDMQMTAEKQGVRRTVVLWKNRFLTEDDLARVDEVRDEALRFLGKPRWQLDQGLRQLVVQRLSGQKLAAVKLAIIGALESAKVDWAIVRAKRRQMFWDAHRDRHIGAIGTFDAVLYCDIASERLVKWSEESIKIVQILQSANEIVLRDLLGKSRSVSLQISGSSRRVVRQAALRGLFYSVAEGSAPFEVSLNVSGPLALFQSSRLYAQGLLEVVKASFECSRFKIEIEFETKAGMTLLALDSAMPLSAIAAGRRFDSRIEEKLCRELSAALIDWSIVREPKPVPSSGRLSFPDILLQHSLRPERKCYVEVVGFWGEAYLRKKIESLYDKGVRPLIVVMDQRLQEDFRKLKDEIHREKKLCDETPHLLTFHRKKLPVSEITAFVESQQLMAMH